MLFANWLELFLRLLFGFLIGSVLGSFATMLTYRLPRKLSIVTPRSHCPSCKTTLGVRDLVPVFSGIASKGKCRHCGAEIGTRYIKIELLLSFSCALVTGAMGFSAWLVVPYALFLAATTAFFDEH
ncbi:MAG: prepilin peptidase [Alphaproteobacteria bacterium]|nr:prepilin peptidase [Alphaproteobacteria bacterium]